MTIALDQPRPARRHLDLSMPLLALLGLFLCALVLLPLLWLAWYSITDSNGALTAANFIKLASDPSFIGFWRQVGRQAVSVARPHGPRRVAQKSGGALAVGQRDFCV